MKVLRLTVTVRIDVKLSTYFDGPQCDLCGKKIMDPTWSKLTSPDGVCVNLHRCCVEPYKRSVASECFQCKKLLIGDYVILTSPDEGHQKLKMHKECVAAYKEAVAPKCAVCSKAILGDYYPYGAAKVHPECNNDYIASQK